MNLGSDHIHIPWVQLVTDGSTLNWIIACLRLCLWVRAIYSKGSFFLFLLCLLSRRSRQGSYIERLSWEHLHWSLFSHYVQSSKAGLVLLHLIQHRSLSWLRYSWPMNLRIAPKILFFFILHNSWNTCAFHHELYNHIEISFFKLSIM